MRSDMHPLATATPLPASVALSPRSSILFAGKRKEPVTMKISRMAMRVIPLVLGVVLSSGANADGVFGIWLHESGEAEVRFAPCGNAVCGRIVWIESGAPTTAHVGDRTFFGMRRI